MEFQCGGRGWALFSTCSALFKQAWVCGKRGWVLFWNMDSLLIVQACRLAAWVCRVKNVLYLQMKPEVEMFFTDPVELIKKNEKQMLQVCKTFFYCFINIKDWYFIHVVHRSELFVYTFESTCLNWIFSMSNQYLLIIHAISRVCKFSNCFVSRIFSCWQMRSCTPISHVSENKTQCVAYLASAVFIYDYVWLI